MTKIEIMSVGIGTDGIEQTISKVNQCQRESVILRMRILSAHPMQ
jgi:23S rRNA maturation-related 3'-5' exoribonuclease YhaM